MMDHTHKRESHQLKVREAGVYQQGGDPEHHVSNVIRVGQVPRHHHLTGSHRQIEASQDPCEDLQKEDTPRSESAAQTPNQLTLVHPNRHNTHLRNIWIPVDIAYVVIPQTGEQIDQALKEQRTVRG